MDGSVAILVTGILCCGTTPEPTGDPVSIRDVTRDLATLVEPVRRLELRLDASLTASLPRGSDRAGISLELATRPDLWYSVGVASGTEQTQVEVVSADGFVTRTVTTSDRTLAWSARVFKRLGPLVLSGGVVDSHAAVGIELRRWQDVCASSCW